MNSCTCITWPMRFFHAVLVSQQYRFATANTDIMYGIVDEVETCVHIIRKNHSIIQSNDTICQWPLQLSSCTLPYVARLIHNTHVRVHGLFISIVHRYVGVTCAVSSFIFFSFSFARSFLYSICCVCTRVVIFRWCGSWVVSQMDAMVEQMKHPRGQLSLTIHKRATDWRFCSFVQLFCVGAVATAARRRQPSQNFLEHPMQPIHAQQ